MNQLIDRRFDFIESLLLACPAVASYEVTQRLVGVAEGKLRVRAVLKSGGFAEFFEYVVTAGRSAQVNKYSYHWQDAAGRLMKRWDNAPHFPKLPNAPHHVHLEEKVVPSPRLPDIGIVIEEIAQKTTTR